MKKYLKILGFVIWVILTIIVVNTLFGMLTLPNTIANIFGVIGLVLYAYISFASNCFTSWEKYERIISKNCDNFYKDYDED